jgi:hypothetical protein
MTKETLARTLWRTHYAGSCGSLADSRQKELTRRCHVTLIPPQKENQSVKARVEDVIRICPHFVYVSFGGTMFQYFKEHSVPRNKISHH